MMYNIMLHLYIQSWMFDLSLLPDFCLIAPYWKLVFLWTVVARVIVIVNGQENKLAEVLVHVLGVKKYINSFGKLGREGLQLWTQKTDDQKSRFWGRIASPGTARVSKLSYFWWEFASSSLKWVVGRHIYELTAESYQRKSKRLRSSVQDCS